MLIRRFFQWTNCLFSFFIDRNNYSRSGFFVIIHMQFNLTSIAAILTVMGFSINDKVVVYDRVRENLRKYKTMPLREQPAYRVTQDATACNQTELLAALIGGQKQIEIAEDLLAHFGNDIRRLYQAHPQELAKVKGINQITAIRIKAALTLGLRLSLPALANAVRELANVFTRMPNHATA